VAQLDDESITLDLNHPLAGQSLTFEVEVVGIV
jgi:FKBP-type peptidyl-prolyl cis-trans isomerase 2